MNTGMVVEAQRSESAAMAGLAGMGAGVDLAERYERLSAHLSQVGSSLIGSRGRLLSPEEWETEFRRYQADLERLRRLGDELRPVSLRERFEPLSGDDLVDEVMELFAA